MSDWPNVPADQRTCCKHPGTGICMCDCHDWLNDDGSDRR